MTNADDAAGRLREVAETVNGYITDNGWNSDIRNMAMIAEPLADFVLRETDPTPITEEFARSAFEKCEWEFDPRRDCLICTIGVLTLLIWPRRNTSRLLGRNMPLLDDATIGDFYTACRLFRVEVKAMS